MWTGKAKAFLLSMPEHIALLTLFDDYFLKAHQFNNAIREQLALLYPLEAHELYRRFGRYQFPSEGSLASI
jgi:hypothetical protein